MGETEVNLRHSIAIRQYHQGRNVANCLSYCHKYFYSLCLLKNNRYFCSKIKKLSLIDIQFGEQVYPLLLSRQLINNLNPNDNEEKPTHIVLRRIADTLRLGATESQDIPYIGTRGDGSTAVGAISQRAIGNQRQGTRHENLRHTGD